MQEGKKEDGRRKRLRGMRMLGRKRMLKKQKDAVGDAKGRRMLEREETAEGRRIQGGRRMEWGEKDTRGKVGCQGRRRMLGCWKRGEGYRRGGGGREGWSRERC